MLRLVSSWSTWRSCCVGFIGMCRYSFLFRQTLREGAEANAVSVRTHADDGPHGGRGAHGLAEDPVVRGGLVDGAAVGVEPEGVADGDRGPGPVRHHLADAHVPHYGVSA